MQITNLSSSTLTLLKKVVSLECVKPFVLVGGSSLSVHLGTRLSEGLAFMCWKSSKTDDCKVNWAAIERELKTFGTVEDVNVKNFDQVEFIDVGLTAQVYPPIQSCYIM